MPNYKLNINVGDGLGFNQDNQLTVKYTGDNIRIVDTGTEGQQGLYVDELTGLPGSVSDNWSTVPSSGSAIDASNPTRTINNFVDINREVTDLIFTYGVYVAGGRNATEITYTSTVKTPADIMNEMNFPLAKNGQNRTSFRPNAGEMLQLVSGPTFRSVLNTDGTNIAAEDGTRSGNNTQTTKVLFLIKEIRYASEDIPPGNHYWVSSMTLTCLYVDPEITAYVVGQNYSTQT